DPAQYEALLQELTAHFGPTDLTTERLVREMADAEWRLRRLRSHLASALATHIETVAQRHLELTDAVDRESRAIETLAETGCSYTTWLRYESRFQNQYDRAYKTWTAGENACRRNASIEAEILMRRAVSVPTPREATAAVSKVTAAAAASEMVAAAAFSEVTTAAAGSAVAVAASNVQTIQAQQPAQIPRNAPCPCKSGEKYKRCCGRAAPRVLRKAA
ncbi:MAG TPA: SEC-C domain-containing protein, partial [Bryobacteraceae bacterium]